MPHQEEIARPVFDMAPDTGAIAGVANRTKTVLPRIVDSVIPREALFLKLDRLQDAALGLIVGPAGYGKSTLARTWIDRRNVDTAWLTLDAEDNDFDRFARFLMVALAEVDLSVVANIRALADRPSRPDVHELAETLADQLGDRDQHLYLVLDEAEHIGDGDVWALLQAIVGYRIPRFHLILISRLDPPMPIGRLRLQQHLIEIRGEELLFQRDELLTMLSRNADALIEARADDLMKATDGWPAGLCLALLASGSGIGTQAPSSEDVQARRSFMLDVLAEDVFDHIPPADRDAMLVVSIVEEICPPLFGALIPDEPDPDRHLTHLRGHGMFLGSSLSGAGWLRLHPLFRDLFARKLADRWKPGDVRTLHERAGTWFESNGMIREAIHHWLLAGEDDRIADLLRVAIPEAFDREDWPLVASWLDVVPDAVLEQRPELQIGRIWILFFRGNWRAMAHERIALLARIKTLPASDQERDYWLSELEVLAGLEVPLIPETAVSALQRLNHAAPRLDPNRPFLRGHVAYGQIMAKQAMGDSAGADEMIHRAIGQMSVRINSALIRVLVARVFVSFQRSDFPALQHAAEELELVAVRNDLPLALGWSLMFQAHASYVGNDLHRAVDRATRLANEHARVHVAALREGKLTLARAWWALGQQTEALGVIRRLRELLVRQNAIELLDSVTSLEQWFQFQMAPQDVARSFAPPTLERLLTSHIAPYQPVINAILIASASNRADVRRAGLQTAHDFLAWTMERNSRGGLVQATAALAVAQDSCGQSDLARSTMRSALLIPAARNVPRAIADMTEAAVRLTSTLEHDPDVGELARQIRSIRDANPPIDPVAPQPGLRPVVLGTSLIETLTMREMDVLTCLDRRLSYKEIGDELFISPLTVKRHAANLYSKLGAENRRTAVALARAMGWRP